MSTIWRFDSDQLERGVSLSWIGARTRVRRGPYHGPRDNRLWTLLGLISETEVKAGRHALSAIVVIKSGDGANRPGSSFFELEKELGRYTLDDDTTWTAEVNALFTYWPRH